MNPLRILLPCLLLAVAAAPAVAATVRTNGLLVSGDPLPIAGKEDYIVSSIFDTGPALSNDVAASFRCSAKRPGDPSTTNFWLYRKPDGTWTEITLADASGTAYGNAADPGSAVSRTPPADLKLQGEGALSDNGAYYNYVHTEFEGPLIVSWHPDRTPGKARIPLWGGSAYRDHDGTYRGESSMGTSDASKFGKSRGAIRPAVSIGPNGWGVADGHSKTSRPGLLLFNESTNPPVAEKAFLEGDVAPGTGGFVFSIAGLLEYNINPQGKVVVRATVGDSYVNYSQQRSGMWVKAPGHEPVKIFCKNDPVPVVSPIGYSEFANRPAGLAPLFYDAFLTGWTMNANGTLATAGFFNDPVWVNARGSQSGLFLWDTDEAGQPSNPRLVAITGEPAFPMPEGTPGRKFWFGDNGGLDRRHSFEEVLINNAGEVLFTAYTGEDQDGENWTAAALWKPHYKGLYLYQPDPDGNPSTADARILRILAGRDLSVSGGGTFQPDSGLPRQPSGSQVQAVTNPHWNETGQAVFKVTFRLADNSLASAIYLWDRNRHDPLRPMDAFTFLLMEGNYSYPLDAEIRFIEDKNSFMYDAGANSGYKRVFTDARNSGGSAKCHYSLVVKSADYKSAAILLEIDLGYPLP